MVARDCPHQSFYPGLIAVAFFNQTGDPLIDDRLWSAVVDQAM